MNHSKDLDIEKLIVYGKAIRDTAAIKRLGYWLDQLSHPGAEFFNEIAQYSLSSPFPCSTSPG
ncbi:MAG: hypothetical protein EA409_09940 [Saprospirales bacterium]|nr:MAG: hypothetical protein EA409_09940 [Saprospirales bacterium]